MNGGAFWSTGTEPTISRTVDFPNVERVTVRAFNDAGEMAEATTRIVTNEEGQGAQNTFWYA